MINESVYADGTYLGNNPTWHEEDSPWKAAQIIKMLERNRIEPETAADIGCGAGEILKLLAEKYPTCRFRGYELSPQAFEICGRKSSVNLQFLHSDPLADDSLDFDLVLAIDVFEHIEDFYGFLRRLRSKGTYKLFHIPLDLSVQSVLRASPIMRLRTSVGHIHYFTRETALAALEQTGYEVVDLCYTAGGIELPDRGWKANLMKLPRKLLFSLQEDIAVRVLGGYSLLVLCK